ncbi:MAG: hypothetical protein RMJ84_06555 [Sandaracinaceae bacterium]|nr:hypothetical protein [Sandaracinaceae bacterium]
MRFTWTLIWIFAPACNCSSKPENTFPAPPPQKRLGSVEGIVRLKPDVDPPRWPREFFFSEVDRPPECPPLPPQPPYAVEMSASRGVTPFAVLAIGDPSRWPRPTRPQVRTLHLKACVLSPPLIVAQREDLIRIENPLTYPFFISGLPGITRAVLPTDPIEIRQNASGIFTLSCTFTAPCGRADVLVVSHPLFTITDQEGRFRIDGIPADVEAEIVAWHPLFGESVKKVWIEAAKTQFLEFEVAPLNPKPSPTPPPSNAEESILH